MSEGCWGGFSPGSGVLSPATGQCADSVIYSLCKSCSDYSSSSMIDGQVADRVG